MKLATWQKAGIIIMGAGLVWAVISFFLSNSPTTASKTQSIGDIKAGDHSPVTIKQQIIDKTVSQTIIDPSKIYLSLWEFSRQIALNQDGIVVPPIYPIKPNEQFIFRIALQQKNDEGLLIPHIHITFPDNVEVTPDMSDVGRAGAWTRSNDVSNTYYLLYDRKFYNSKIYNLPSLLIKIKDAIVSVSYSMTVDGLSQDIVRHFIIDTSLDYNKYYKEHFSFNTAENVPELMQTLSADTSGVFRQIVYDYDEKTKGVTASSSCVNVSPRNLQFIIPSDEIKSITQPSNSFKVTLFQSGNHGNSVTPVVTLNSYPQKNIITVTPDSDTQK